MVPFACESLMTAITLPSGYYGKPIGALPGVHNVAEEFALHLKRAEENGSRRGPRVSMWRVGHGVTANFSN